MAVTWKGSPPPGVKDSDLPSGANIVDWIAAPHGGYWLLNGDGGVFSVGGAPFFGSRPGSQAARIQSDGQGGYQLLGQDGNQFFAGAAPKQADPPKTESAPGAATTDTSGSAKAYVTNTLASMVPGLSGADIDTLTSTYNTLGTDGMYLKLRDMPAYKARYPGMDALVQKGRAISETTYQSIEKSFLGTARAAGIPADFTTPDLMGKLIGGEVSPQEWDSRVTDAATAAFKSPAGVRAALAQTYGLSGGDIVGYFMDPTKTSNILQQRTIAGAQTIDAAGRAGYGALTKDEAENIGFTQGVNPDQANKGFGQLTNEKQLFDLLPGEAGQTVTRQQQLGAEFGGDAVSQEAIRRAAEARTSVFKGGGGFEEGSTGVTGAGVSK